MSNKNTLSVNNGSDAVVVKASKKALEHNEESDDAEEIGVEVDSGSESESEAEGNVVSEHNIQHSIEVRKRPTFCIKQTDFVQLSPELASRLLHPNPCCFLTTIPTVTEDNASQIQPLNASE